MPPKVPLNQYFPSFGDYPPKTRGDMKNLWDRVNYLVGRVGAMEKQGAGQTDEAKALKGEISSLKVALQTVSDALTQGSTFVNAPDGSQVVNTTPQVSTSPRLLGRYSPGSGPMQEIQVGTNLTLTAGGVLNASGGGGGGSDLTPPPVSSSFTWRNQETATVTDSSDLFVASKKVTGWRMDTPANTGSPDIRVLEVNTPSTPYTITIAHQPMIFAEANYLAGIGWIENATGELVIFEVGAVGSSTQYFRVSRWGSVNAFDGSYVQADFYAPSPLVWMQISDDGVNRICRVSGDGNGWIQIHSVSRTDFLTPDRIGICLDVNGGGGNFAPSITLVHWVQS